AAGAAAAAAARRAVPARRGVDRARPRRAAARQPAGGARPLPRRARAAAAARGPPARRVRRAEAPRARPGREAARPGAAAPAGRLCQHGDDRAGAAIAEANLGSTALAAGDPVAAEKRLAPAVQSLVDLGARGAAAHATVLLARAVALQGRAEHAQELLLGLDAQASARLANAHAPVAGPS